MLTSRAWWFLLFDILVLCFGILGRQPALGLLGLALLLWFLSEWLLFAIRSKLTLRNLYVERTVSDERSPVETLWAGQSFTVHVRVHLDARFTLSFAIASDRVPFAVEHLDGETECQGTLEAGKPFELMLYPAQRHAVSDPPLVEHMRSLMLDFVLRTLRPAATGGS